MAYNPLKYSSVFLLDWMYVDGFKEKLENDASYKGLWTLSGGCFTCIFLL
jgi:hypothetical protein